MIRVLRLFSIDEGDINRPIKFVLSFHLLNMIFVLAQAEGKSTYLR